MEITTELLDRLSTQARTNERLRINYDLRNSSDDQSQRMLNALQPGTIVPVHRHTQSSEIVSIVRGAIREFFYDKNGELTETVELRYGCSVPLLVVPKGVWHNLECLEPDTVIFECKDGAYEPIKEEDILYKG
ncbi:MAG: WbuC family cupin fold metalloprotein [Paludibacteraceae bacterium]|nr:WbuC family cupin fold metalloprotein [Paludibacteraceae bacterium]